MPNDVVIMHVNDLIKIIHTLRSIDKVDGFENMDRLVGVVSYLEQLANNESVSKQKEQKPTAEE